MKKIDLVQDHQTVISHIVLQEAVKKPDFIKHWKTIDKDKDIEVKITIEGYEITLDSFQDFFMELWNLSENSEDARMEAAAKSRMSKKLTKLCNKIEDMTSFFEHTNIDLENIDW